jgi:alpha-mannosidase
MLKHPQVTEERIARTIDRIGEILYRKTAPLKVEAHHIGGEPISAKQAAKQSFQPFQIGDAWGPPWDTTWFRFSGVIPAEWVGEEIVALIRLGARAGEGFTSEGLVWQNGKPMRAINVNRAEVPLAKSAKGGEAVEFYVEAAANPTEAQHRKEQHDPAWKTKPLFRLEQADIACFNRAAWDLFNDFSVAFAAMQALPEGSRRGQLLYALNVAANVFDEIDPASFAQTRAILNGVLNKRNGDSTHTVSAIGHAHIDTAWLWPLRETIRKCARTFATQLAYMEEFPEYVFTCSQPQQYAWMKVCYPEIYEGIKDAVRRGQWEPIGSMWVEADCNISSGESLVRQLLHGRNFFLEEFGCEPLDVWLPDTFGYNAALPQITRKAGANYFLGQKLSWNQFNAFPHHTFLWEGIDGSRIFTHFPPADTYNATMDPRQLAQSVRNFREHDRAARSLYIFGFGDGGGGPTKGMLETARRVENLEGLPRVELEKVASFFSKAEADAHDLPVWVGELYLETHRGTYTTQARNKKGNRKSELLLRDAEFFDVASLGDFKVEPNVGKQNRAVYDVIGKNLSTSAAYRDRAWKLLLLNQFHDILPGSSIHRVYEESMGDYAKIAMLARAVLEPARESVAARINTSAAQQPLIIFNTSSFARSEIVSLPGGGAPVRVEVPPCGYAVVDAGDQRPVASFAMPVEIFERKKLVALDNGMLRIIFDRDGLIRSIKDHRVRREVLAPGQRGNIFQLHRDLPNKFDAWDVDIFHLETREDIHGVESIEVVENTPLRGTVRIARKFGNGSTITQRISLCAGSPRIDFETEVDWREEHKFLKVAFPVNVRSPRATYEIQFGNVERPTHFNTSWDLARFEVPAQKWADLSEGDYGVALLNDCKYGYNIFGNVLRLSLLRAPTAPDPEADRGHHQFTYSLLPHVGDFRQGRVIEHAYALNIPLQVIAAEPHAGELPKSKSFFQVDRPGVIIEAIKRAEKENAIIVRLYEAYGTRGNVTLSTTLPVKQAFTADLMERTSQPLEFDDGSVIFPIAPFEIVTLKFPLE